MPRPKRDPLSPDEIRQLETLSGLGLSLEQVALTWKTSIGTLKRRIKETPECSDPLKRGRAVALTNVAKSLYQQATSGNMAAICFYLKTRGGKRWREKDRVEVTGKDGKPIEHAHSVEFVTVEKLVDGKSAGEVRYETVKK